MSKMHANAEAGYLREITYLSPPAPVNMGDLYYEIASLDHFWIRRRFAVLRALAGKEIAAATEMAEIGCGHGLLQRQIEDAYGKEVSGFDLNVHALQQNASRRSRVYCYDIFQTEAMLRARFSIIFLFDVLEHIPDEHGFLKALQFHMKPEGKLLINVPAGQWAFSRYDQAAGHVRRYSSRTLRDSVERSGFEVQAWTYWGLPLVPTLAVRKLWVSVQSDRNSIISTGFDSRSAWMNKTLLALSRAEIIPQTLLGTSLMAILSRGKEGK